ncbi:endonuclease domain-containing protein [Streptomyces harbinensis]
MRGEHGDRFLGLFPHLGSPASLSTEFPPHRQPHPRSTPLHAEHPNSISAVSRAAGSPSPARGAPSPDRYRRDVTDWLNFTQHTLGISAFAARAHHAETWLDIPHRRDQTGRTRDLSSPHNRARRLSALSAYYTYCEQHAGIPQPFDIHQLRPATAKLPRTQPLTLHHTVILHLTADALTHPHPAHDRAHRDRALIHAMLAGYRPRQYTALNLPHLDPDRHGATMLYPKGDGTHFQPWPRTLWHAVQDYLPHRQPTTDPTAPLFTSPRGLRLNANVTPTAVLRAAAEHANTATAALHPGQHHLTIPPDITPDQLARSPHPHHTPGDGTLAARLHTDLQHLTTTPIPHTPRHTDHCQPCTAATTAHHTWTTAWETAEFACWTWTIPPYNPHQDPARRYRDFHQRRCVICGVTAGPGDEHHTDHDENGLVRGQLCTPCTRTTHTTTPYTTRYRQRPPHHHPRTPTTPPLAPPMSRPLPHPPPGQPPAATLVSPRTLHSHWSLATRRG